FIRGFSQDSFLKNRQARYQALALTTEINPMTESATSAWDEGETITYTDLCPTQLVELAVLRGEGTLSPTGALVTTTGRRTGRSPADRFIVQEPSTADNTDWGKVNRPYTADKFKALWAEVEAHVDHVDHFISCLDAAQDPEHYIPVNTMTETAWHSLFASNMFI